MMYWGYPEDVAGLNPLELSGQRLALNNIWIPIVRTLHVDAGKGFHALYSDRATRCVGRRRSRLEEQRPRPGVVSPPQPSTHSLRVSEVALSIALLTCAGLMMRTIYALRHVPLQICFRESAGSMPSIVPTKFPIAVSADRNLWSPCCDSKSEVRQKDTERHA
jgi:hypothetical protein